LTGERIVGDEQSCPDGLYDRFGLHETPSVPTADLAEEAEAASRPKVPV
jgi:hypothetical protein